MKHLPKIIIALVFTGTLTACASPKPDRRSPPKQFQGGLMLKPAGLLFAGFDNNQDYTVDRAELASGLERAFLQADVDGSGQLTLFEYQDWASKALGAPTAMPGWMELDRDASTSIDPIEFRGGFERLAQNYGLSKPEGLQLSALAQNMEGMMSGARSSGGRSGGPKGGGGRPTRFESLTGADSMSGS